MSGREKVFRYGGGFASQIISRAEGSYIYTDSGRAILDFTSGQMSGILGHSHPEIVEVVRQMASCLDHLHSGFLSDPVTAFAEDLCGVLPDGLDRVLPLSTGGEANEAALRMAKTFTGGYEIVAFDRSWHGVTGGAAATTYSGGRRGHGPSVPGVLTLPTPHAYRSPFNREGAYNWRDEELKIPHPARLETLAAASSRGYLRWHSSLTRTQQVRRQES